MKLKLINAIPYSYAPFFRGLHIAVAVLILSQIINSNFIEAELLTDSSVEGVITWLHVVSGFLLIFLGLTLLAWMLSQRGFRWYYAWMMLDFNGIRRDIKLISQRKLPEAAQGGIAAAVQGLGVLALLLVASSGGVWFLAETLLKNASDAAEYYLRLHKFLTTFIEIYFYAHGLMGLLHMLLVRNTPASGTEKT